MYQNFTSLVPVRSCKNLGHRNYNDVDIKDTDIMTTYKYDSFTNTEQTTFNKTTDSSDSVHRSTPSVQHKMCSMT